MQVLGLRCLEGNSLCATKDFEGLLEHAASAPVPVNSKQDSAINGHIESVMNWHLAPAACGGSNAADHANALINTLQCSSTKFRSYLRSATSGE